MLCKTNGQKKNRLAFFVPAIYGPIASRFALYLQPFISNIIATFHTEYNSCTICNCALNGLVLKEVISDQICVSVEKRKIASSEFFYSK